MSLPQQSAPISAQARLCLVSFQQCLQRATSLDTQRYSNLEDQMARFSIWTSNMAVFATPRACMDYRVREVPDVQRLVLGLLGVLEGRIQECKISTNLVRWCPGSDIQRQQIQAIDSSNMLQNQVPRSRHDYPRLLWAISREVCVQSLLKLAYFMDCRIQFEKLAESHKTSKHRQILLSGTRMAMTWRIICGTTS